MFPPVSQEEASQDEGERLEREIQQELEQEREQERQEQESQAGWGELPFEDEEDFVPGGRHSQDDPPGPHSRAPGTFTGGGGAGEGGGGMPRWEEAHSTIIHTMRHIPKAAREDWARVLTSTIQDVCAQPEEARRGERLYILPQCVLAARPREQGAAAQKAAKAVRAACKRWR